MPSWGDAVELSKESRMMPSWASITIVFAGSRDIVPIRIRASWTHSGYIYVNLEDMLILSFRQSRPRISTVTWLGLDLSVGRDGRVTLGTVLLYYFNTTLPEVNIDSDKSR